MEKIRLTFTGDILCYASQDSGCCNLDGTYDYTPIFEQVEPLFKDSDYVVGSFETTLSGENVGYTHGPISFNTPDSFTYALKNVGFDLLTTANNHCWDRGEKGLIRTLHVLDKVGIEHTGTRYSENDKRYIVKDFNGTKVAFLSYTYGVNNASNGETIPLKKEYLVNFTREQIRTKRPLYKRILGRLLRMVRKSDCSNGIVLDCVSDKEVKNNRNIQYEDAMIEIIKQAKSEADVVIMCLHSGGQFNSEVGTYTKHLFDVISAAGADAIITNHAHTILPIYKQDNCIIVSGLGNFSFAPGEGYYVDGVFANYSIVLYLDIFNKSISDISFSICKSVINSNGLAVTKPIYDMRQEKEIKKDIDAILKKIHYKTNTNNSVLQIYNFQI